MVAGSLTYKTELDDNGFDKGLKKISSASGKAISTFSKAITGITAAGATAVGGLVFQSVKAFARYEQLVGGIDTLFKNSSQKLQGYADKAFKTAGMSANDYMDLATTFSASLLQSLNGDTNKAADYTNRAITDMSDNVNKMGTSIESLRFAYQGFSKQNYTMLDNLKLGYGGTKDEMIRLVNDASKLTDVQKELGITVKANSLSFGNVVNAISVMQKKMGIMGTTAKEASTTIEGSLNSVKASWENLIVGITNPDADWEQLIDDLVISIENFASNVKPAIKSALVGVTALIRDLLPKVAEEIPILIMEFLPKLIETGAKIIETIILGIKDNIPLIVDSTIQIISTIITVIAESAPKLIEAGGQLIKELIIGITQKLPELASEGSQAIKLLSNGLSVLIPLLLAIKSYKIAVTIVKIVKSAMTLAKAIKGVTVAQTLLNTAMLFNPIGLVVAGIVALISAFVILWNKSEAFRNFWINLWETIKTVVSSTVNGIITFFTETIPSFWEGFIEKLNLIGENIKTFFINTWNSIVNFFTEKIPEAFNKVIEWFAKLPYLIGFHLGQTLAKIVNLGINIWNWINNDLPQIIKGITDWFAKLPGRVWNWLVQTVNNVYNWGVNLYNTSKYWASQTIRGIIDWFKQLPGRIWNFLSQVIKNVYNWGRNLYNSGKSAAGDLYDSIIDTLWHLPGKMWEIGKDIVRGIWNGIVQMKDWIKNKVGDFANGIVDGFKSKLQIHSPSKVMAYWSKYIPQGVAVGIEADTDKATKAIDEMNNQIEQKFKNAISLEQSKINANANIKANYGMLNTTNLDLKVDGDVKIDGRKAGILLAKPISQTIKRGGVYA